MPISSRVGDQWVGICCCHSDPTCIGMGGIIVTGSPDTISSGLGQAAVPDMTIGWCGHPGFIVTGSPDTLANNKSKATVGSQVTGCNIGTVVTGNPTHNVN